MKVDLFDPVAERMVLTALIQHGADVLYDIESLIKDHFLYMEVNQLIYSSIKELITDNNIDNPSITSILGHIQTLKPEGFKDIDIAEYLAALSVDQIPVDEVDVFAKRVARFALARNLQFKLHESVSSINKITGNEELREIIALAENPILEFSKGFIQEDNVVDMSTYLQDYLEFVKEFRPEFHGVPSGFNRYDYYIGGGFRTGIHVIGGRAKAGKSYIGLKAADNLVKQGVPVLYLDTELTEEIMAARWAAMQSGVPIKFIEDGSFQDSQQYKNSIEKISSELGNKKFTYYSIRSKHHTEWLSIMRRWIMNDVGFNSEGQLNDCLIIVDYIKMMQLEHAGNFAEHQYLGQVVTDLHDFAGMYNLPILAFVQLNREGIHRSDQGVIAGSDKIVQLCSSFSILRKKSEEDFAADPIQNGDRKLEIIETRFGPALPPGQYINIITDLEAGQIKEGKTNIENRNEQNSPSSLVNHNDNNEEKIQF